MGNSNGAELPDQGDNIIRTHDEKCVSKPKGFGYELFECMKPYTNSIAQTEASTGETDTFDSLRQRCIRVAIELKNRGVTPNDIITPCTANHLDTSVVFLAPLLIGAKVASLDPQMPAEDIKGLLDLTRPKFVFVSKDAEEKLSSIVEQLKIETGIVVFGDTVTNIPFTDFSKPITEEEEKSFVPWRVVDPNETAFIIFSSGSTGVPKGVCCNHTIACQIIKFVQNGNFGGIMIAYSTLVWGSGVFSVIVNIVCGTPRLVCSIFETAKTWEYIEKYKPVRMILAPHDCISMIKYGRPSGADSSSVQVVSTAGGSLSLKSIAALKQLFPEAFVCCPYGQTEVFNQIFCPDKLSLLQKKPNIAGWPVKGIWYKIVDPITNKVCGPNEKGELRVKTRFQMTGYYKMDSSDSWDEDGYLKTGDIAYYDEDHSFFIVERLKEVLRYKMHAVAPSYLENVLHEHDGVKVAVVTGKPADEGDLLTALVVKSNLKDVTECELVEYVAARVKDKEKLRGGVTFIQECEVLRTASGKIRRYLMRRKMLEEIDMNK